jgi:hypothetical protein
MSNFLSRLVGQKLNPSQAIQPSLPSIHESYRRRSAPSWAEHQFVARERGPEPGSESGAQENLEVENGRAAERQPAPPMPLSSDREHTSPPTSHSLSAAVSQTKKKPGHPRGKASRAPEGPLSSNVFSDLQFALGDHPATVTAARQSAAREIRTGESSTGSPPRQSRPAQSAGATAGILGDSPLPSRMQPVPAPPQPIASASAPQSAKPIDLLIAHGAANHTTDSEPALQVTIGRVEVRAVFPAPPPRRVPPVGRKPSLSLDDYLKRNLKGNPGRR